MCGAIAELDPNELQTGDVVSFEWGTGRDGRPISHLQ
jgi:hypothetical protein